MEILKNNNNLKLLIDTDQNFRIDLGWEENFVDFEKEVLNDIINPAKNYETVRYIHRPYLMNNLNSLTETGKQECDIWFKFYFLSGTTYVQDYSADNVGITVTENELMLKQSTESFFRLEFYKTPGTVTNGVLTCDPPTRQNRRFVNSKNLTLPLGEKFFYEPQNSGFYIHLPIFTGSNYRNKENMYLFWFLEDDAFEGTMLTGTTFYMTARFFNGEDGTVLNFSNTSLATNASVLENRDLYYKVTIDRSDYSYQVFRYSGTTGTRIGKSGDPIKFYEIPSGG